MSDPETPPVSPEDDHPDDTTDEDYTPPLEPDLSGGDPVEQDPTGIDELLPEADDEPAIIDDDEAN